MRADEFERRLSDWLATDAEDGEAGRLEAATLRAEAARRGEPEALVSLLTLRGREAARDWVEVEPPGADWSGFEQGLAARLADPATLPARPSPFAWRRALALAAAVVGIAIVGWLALGPDSTGNPDGRVGAGIPAGTGDRARTAESGAVASVGETRPEVPGDSVPGSRVMDSPDTTAAGTGDPAIDSASDAAGSLIDDPLLLAEGTPAAGDPEWDPTGFGGSPVDLVEPVGLDFPELARLDAEQRDRLLRWLQEENARYGGAS